MSDPTDEPQNPVHPAEPSPEATGAAASPAGDVEVEELTPAGGPLDAVDPEVAPARQAEAEAEAEVESQPEPEPAAEVAAEVEAAPKPVPAPAPHRPRPAKKEKPRPAAVVATPVEPAAPAAVATPVGDDDDEEKPQLVWYVLKVQSSREDTIRDALERRVKIQGLQRYFGRIVVPTEKITEIRNNKKRIVERKTYPGYIMVEMELNEKTWFVVRETPGVGDFVGAHGTPTKMTEAEVNQMLGQQTAVDTGQAPKVVINVERGDRVKIKDGPFENFEGTVEEVVEARGSVKVMLIIFNRPTPVDLEYWQVERL